MKIKSHIQKIFAVLFLLAFFSSCTDEVIDGGGSGTTPVEVGKPVNVKFALGKAGEQTVVTKSDDKPEVEELLFLQYSGEDLVYAWYTDKDDDFKIKQSSDDDKDKDDFEGWGADATVRNIKLLSGSGYTVYVIANVDLDEDNGDFEEERDEDDDRGPVNITKTAIQDEFGTVTKLKAWTRNNSNFLDDEEDSDEDKYQYPDIDDDIMFGIASNMADPNNEKSNYTYTKMATNYSESYTSVNDSKNDYTVDIAEGSTICSTLYPPYSKVTLTIVGAESFKATINVSSVELINCPKDYSLFSGYKLSGGSADLNDPIKLNSNEIEVSSGRTSTDKELSTVFVYENMAGSLGNKMKPFDNTGLDQPGYPYTYIKVTGTYTEGRNTGKVVYRFILGKDASTDCNIERNVHYNVTMTLKGDGGVNETTWTVNYDGKKEEEKPDDDIRIESDGIDRLDAHATITPITFYNLKAGTYYLKTANGEQSLNQHGGSLVDVVEGDATITKENNGNNDSFELNEDQAKVVINYRQDNWFQESGNMNNGNPNEHNVGQPQAVATADCNEYTVNVYLGKKKKEPIGSMTVKQYPPVVVYMDPLWEDSEEGEKPISALNRWSNITYMERFDNDHPAELYGGWEKWVIVDLTNPQNESYNYSSRLFDGNSKRSSESCYWLNLYGPLEFKNGQNTYEKVSFSETAWPYVLNSTNEERYIIQN